MSTTENPSSLPPPSSTPKTLPHGEHHIALIGLGAIGISFLALHLTYTSATVSVYDPRPDLREHVASILPLYLPESKPSTNASDPIVGFISSGRLRFCTSLADAVHSATIVQEQGPENLAFKQKTWSEVLRHVSEGSHLWSSTSGIPASEQLAHLDSTSSLSEGTRKSAKERLLVVHPFNPPHLMPLLELVPSPSTLPSALKFASEFFKLASPLHRPIPIARETKGFVANRLSFILFREACSLVARGVCSAADLDEIVRASLGPRWAVGGPFKMYNFGGGDRGIEGFLENIGGSIGEVWADNDAQGGGFKFDEEGEGGKWKGTVVEQVRQAYGVPRSEDVRKRDRALREVVKVQEEIERK
ncbi:hypothetical protein H2200_003103 [Cladophialophora chaetospira]|uniref:3-hydroxyacyl-CoA dehydrogenase n=1 Tax=Cladophialophora chaetospira TaxID=386627 RepID=A0AA39CLZ1_9EURO|nr:hypothetical protein H2200_003103 [Cladophialophora chaetospira]